MTNSGLKQQPTKSIAAMLLGIMLVGCLVRAFDVWRPVDGTVRDSWREPDVAGIAKNYYQEGMNLFLPRIDWRGDGPGYVESEFPIYPWLVACLYQVFGYHEELLRLISYILSLGSLAVFFLLARDVLPRRASLLACAVFAVNPMAIRMASAIKPEPLMFLAYLSAVYWFSKWLRTDNRRDYWIAMGATILAILAKLPSAHVGLLFAALCLQRYGWRALRRLDVWAFAIVALGLPLAWYAYAHTLFVEFGNSLGMSNEAYGRITSGNFLSTALLTLQGVLQIEAELVWTVPGMVLGAIGLFPAWSDRRSRWLIGWLLTLIVFYFVTGRTTGESWAEHYHIVSVPLAALLIGSGSGLTLRWFSGQAAPVAARTTVSLGGTWLRRLASIGLALLCLATIAFEVRRVRWDLHPNRFADLYEFAATNRDRLQDGSLIVASGANQLDQFGLPRAFNAPYFFFWTGHKGFTLGNDDQSVVALERLRRRGAGYFFAERKCLDAKAGFERQLRQRYQVLAEAERVILFKLGPEV